MSDWHKSRVRVFDGDASDDLSTALRIRREVFVDGQGVPEDLELDGLDPACVHFLVEVDRGAGWEPLGAARMRAIHGAIKAERVAVLEAARGLGLGVQLMEALHAEARQQGHDEAVLNAQVSVIGFYERQGYVAEGRRFYEADIPHQKMRRTL